MKTKKVARDTHSYKGWLNSDSFLKRAFAVCGYSMVPVLIFYGIILAMIIIVGMAVGIASLFA